MKKQNRTTPFDSILEEIKYNQDLLEKGNKTFLTLQPIFPKLSTYLPGLVKGDLITITGSTGHSKSKLTWHLANSFLKYKDFDVHILYNALEESQTKIASAFILNYLKKKGYSLTFYELMNYKNSPHSTELIQHIEDAVKLFNVELADRLKIYQETTPSEFYKRVVEYLSTLGKFYYQEKDKQGNVISQKEVDYTKGWNHFEYNNSNTFVIYISDHIWNYNNEKGMTKYDSVAHFSRHFCRIKLCMQCGCIGINVQQQENRKDTSQYASKTGQVIKDHYYPDTKSVADIKSTINDCTLVLGIFAPSRYKAITKHNGYDMDIVGDKFRALFILKTREANQVEGDRSLSLLFDGRNNYFEELPNEADKGYKMLEKYFKN